VENFLLSKIFQLFIYRDLRLRASPIISNAANYGLAGVIFFGWMC
jgi:hypothetical protein